MPGQRQAFDEYLLAVDLVDRRIGNLETTINELASDGPHAEVIGNGVRVPDGGATTTSVRFAGR